MTDVAATVEQVRSKMAGVGRGPVVVAASGGLDSCVLLHLLGFQMELPGGIVAAHFDHGMRKDSGADASWMKGLTRAWRVPVTVERASRPPRSEEEARTMRYSFLNRVASERAASAVVTAHHADDQAETVLFRVLRGTGPSGLRGIPAARDPCVVRPLLDLWRSELEDYARQVGLRWREDPTNADLDPARNVIRSVILPIAEEGVAPGARRSLVRLAAIAEADEAAWTDVLPRIVATLDPARGRIDPVGETGAGDVGGAAADGSSVDRRALLSLGRALRARVIRWLAAEEGGGLDASATTRALDFTEVAVSGRTVDLGAGLLLRRDLDRFVIGRRAGGALRPNPGDAPDGLVIPGRAPGGGRSTIGGTGHALRWGLDDAGVDLRRGPREAGFAPDDLVFPLLVRGWRAGDRIRTAGGTKKLKKLFLEAGVPIPDRHRAVVVADDTGRVLWVPGVARAADVPPGAFRIRIET